MKSKTFFAFILFNIACLLLLHCSLGPFPGGVLPGESDVESLRYGSGGRPAGGGEEEDTGNCLSVPVLFSDGVTKPLRGDFGVPVFYGEFAVIEEDNWYLQQDPLNRWQAESEVIGDADIVYVNRIDWGDNLEAKSWPVNAKIRVETVLWINLDADSPMTAFEMSHLSGLGSDEMWGTNEVTYDSSQATVYSHCARLTIQKIPEEGAELEWKADTGQWGGAGEALFIGGVWEAGDGPGYYSAEINIGGKLIYGYTWDAKKANDGIGFYRLTFSLFDEVTDPVVVLNTSFDDAVILSKDEESSEAGEIPSGGVAVIDKANNLTYIDVELVKAKGGGNGGPPQH